jgi:hypothetical protein
MLEFIVECNTFRLPTLDQTVHITLFQYASTFICHSTTEDMWQPYLYLIISCISSRYYEVFM